MKIISLVTLSRSKKNETNPYPCDAYWQNFKDNFDIKEHMNTNNVEFIEVLETTRLKLNKDNVSGNFDKK